VSLGLQPIGDREFDQVVAAAGVPVLVEFWKPGCGHCRALARELEQVQAEIGPQVLILSMNVEEHHQIAAELEIMSLPALALYQNGRFSRFIGGIGRKKEILSQLGLGRASA
jgi:thioredoxin 1